MNLIESFRIALDSIVSQKLRSSLTLLGVIIGVMTIIATMSVIRGLQQMVEKEMSILSAGVFQVQQFERDFNGNHWRRESPPKIGMREVRAIEENVPLAQIVAPEVWKYVITVKYKDEATNPNIVVAGGVPGFAPNNGYMVERGRFLTDQDVHFARPVVVLAQGVANKLFPFRNPVGEYVTINGNRAQVVGVFEGRGSMFNDNSDYHCVVPITTFTRWWGDRRSWFITVQTSDPSKIQDCIDQTVAALRGARNVKPGEKNNFGIFHSNQLVDSFNDMTKWIRIAAFGIASIALIVAGVGIMNIMLVSVTERTREIGVRKALGARRRSIMSQFLVEAVILTEIGAFIGVVVGVAGAFLLGKAADLPVAVPAWSVMVGILFCSFIGLVFGTWPAWKASRMDPIVSLRYE
ncbi:ABC transporter permease [bacterium]|nr:ABC transporter permease [bacterium]